MTPQIPIPKEKLAEFCRKHHIRKLSLFGSVLRPDFGPGSDVDVLVEFDQRFRITLFDMVHMQEELELLFGRKVDLLSEQGLLTSRNYLRKDAILNSAQVVYG
jgi:predicted nucleotidyltransferase